MDHDTIPILEEHQHDVAAIHGGINDLLKSRTNINVNEISKDIINLALRCRSHKFQQSLFLVLFIVLKFLAR